MKKLSKFFHQDTHFVCNRITSDPCNGHVGVGNHLAILDVEATDVDEVSIVPVAWSEAAIGFVLNRLME